MTLTELNNEATELLTRGERKVYELDSRLVHNCGTVAIFTDLRPEPIDEPKHRVLIQSADGVTLFDQYFYSWVKAWETYQHPFATIPTLQPSND